MKRPLSRILRALPWIVIVVLVAGATALGTRTLRTSCENLGQPDRFPFGSVVLVPCFPGYVVNGGEPRFYVAVTPQGRALEWDPYRRLFHDPDWREVFDAHGEPLGGAGPSLRECELELKGKGRAYFGTTQNSLVGCARPPDRF